MTTAIVDYGSGNLHSAFKAFHKVGSSIGETIVVTDRPDEVRKADRIMLPGVGAFGDCVAGLSAIDGMTDALRERVISEGAPFLGVCVGMQLLAEAGFERGRHEGLSWIPGRVERIAPEDPLLKIPHMGWNQLQDIAPHPALAGLSEGDFAYFVHSFHYNAIDHTHVLSTVDYSGPLTAVIGRDNLVGAQFHPEKSQKVGLRLIDNFLRWRP